MNEKGPLVFGPKDGCELVELSVLPPESKQSDRVRSPGLSLEFTLIERTPSVAYRSLQILVLIAASNHARRQPELMTGRRSGSGRLLRVR